MNTKLVFGALLVMVALIGAVSAQNTIDVTAEIPAALSISVTNTVPSPWILSRTDGNVLSDVISIATSNDVDAIVTATGSNGGYLAGTKGSLSDPIKSGTFYYSVGGTLETLPVGSRTTLYGLTQPLEVGDKPGTYSGTLTYVIEAV